MSYSHTFRVIEFNVFKGLALQAINVQITFIWTFTDLFVVIISTSIAYRLSQITFKMRYVKEANVIKNNLKNTINIKKKILD